MTRRSQDFRKLHTYYLGTYTQLHARYLPPQPRPTSCSLHKVHSTAQQQHHTHKHTNQPPTRAQSCQAPTPKPKPTQPATSQTQANRTPYFLRFHPRLLHASSSASRFPCLNSSLPRHHLIYRLHDRRRRRRRDKVRKKKAVNLPAHCFLRWGSGVQGPLLLSFILPFLPWRVMPVIWNQIDPLGR